MVKAYLRYVPSDVFGVVASSCAVYDLSGDLVITAALESVHIWHVRRGVLVC